jgi:uncharacterized membrane protein
MPDDEPATDDALWYATPAATRPSPPVLAVASIIVALLSALFAALMSFREGLTNAEANRQMLIGKVSGAVGCTVAVALALLSYRQRASHHGLSHVAITLSIAAILYIITRLPPW